VLNEPGQTETTYGRSTDGDRVEHRAIVRIFTLPGPRPTTSISDQAKARPITARSRSRSSTSRPTRRRRRARRRQRRDPAARGAERARPDRDDLRPQHRRRPHQRPGEGAPDHRPQPVALLDVAADEEAEAPRQGEEHRAIVRIFTLPGGFRLLVGRDVEERDRLRAVIITARSRSRSSTSRPTRRRKPPGRVKMRTIARCSTAWSLMLVVGLGFLGSWFIAQRVLKRVDHMTEITPTRRRKPPGRVKMRTIARCSTRSPSVLRP
jgi:hypothetical protein